MKLWKPIIGFVTHKKVLSSVIGIAMVGSVSAAAVAANNGVFTIPAVSSSAASSAVSVESVSASVKSSETSSAASSAAASSTPASSASSTVSSKPASVASSTPSKASTISTVSVDNTATRQKAISDENTRHNNAVAAINSQYDSQIAAVQNEISAFQSEGARDTTGEIQAAKDELDRQYKNISTEDNNPVAGTDITHALHVKTYNENCEIFQDKTYPQLKKLNDDFQKLKSDLDLLPSLKSQKQQSIANENSLNQSQIAYINSIYP